MAIATARPDVAKPLVEDRLVLDREVMKRAPLRGNRVAPIGAWGCAAADAKFDVGIRSGLGGSQPEDWGRVGRPRVFFPARMPSSIRVTRTSRLLCPWEAENTFNVCRAFYLACAVRLSRFPEEGPKPVLESTSFEPKRTAAEAMVGRGGRGPHQLIVPGGDRLGRMTR